MSEFLMNVITNRDEINRIFKTRSKPYLEKTVTGKTIEIAKQKAQIETKEGWGILSRTFKRSVKLRRLKSSDVRLEDEVWSMLVRMGFDEYSKDRNFRIFIDDKTPLRQIDVFAKDSETALLLECTASEERKEKNLNELIEKILSMNSEVFTSINKYYGSSVKLKIRWIIATRNIIWRPADLNKADANKIIVLRDEEIDYYKKLTDLLKTAAKYQLLAHVFSQEKIHELDIQAPPPKEKWVNRHFIIFLSSRSSCLRSVT